MGSEKFANGSIVYTSDEDEKRTCIDSLKDDAHYRFSCRCGCGAEFAGYGRDIKATGKIGRRPADSPTVTTVDSTGSLIVGQAVTITTPTVTSFVLDDTAAAKLAMNANRSETAENPRPYVSDRFLQKALWGLSDDEVDIAQEGRPDQLEAQGVKLSERQPPAIGDKVFSLATNEGPFSLLEYQQHEVNLEGGGTTRLLCGLCRAQDGGYQLIPLADLDRDYDGRPVLKTRSQWLAPALVVLASSLVGSLVAVAYYAL